MLTYPAVLTIKVSDKATGESLSQVALIVTILASKKGDYHISRVTNAAGEVRLTIEEVRHLIHQRQELFIMDYASSLEECSDEIEIEICDREQIKRTTAAMEMYQDIIDIDKGLIEAFRNSVNDRYVVPVFQRSRIDASVTAVQVGIEPLTR